MKTHVPSVKAFALILFAVITQCNAAYAQGRIEVIVNGGFETGDLTGWSGPAANPNPWSASVTYAHTGNYSAYNPVLPTATIVPTLYQMFSQTPLNTVSTAGFWYEDPGGAHGLVGVATLLYFSDGTTVQDTLFANDPSYRVNSWAYRDLLPTLSAHPDKQLVGIGFFPGAGMSQYVDDVSIVGIIPEPSTAILGCLGLLAMALRFVWRAAKPNNALAPTCRQRPGS